MLISVVIPTFNRPVLLDRCLGALLAQEHDPSAFEVIVADDAASDETRSLVEEIAGRSKFPIVYIAVTDTQGPAGARNAGWRHSRGAVVAFTDDDCVPQRSWLAAATQAFVAEPGLAAATGCVIVPLPDAPTDYQRDAAGLERAEFVTANCFCRREVLDAIGGFDEEFRDAWREDSDLQFRLIEQGYTIRCIPGASVLHPIRPARWGISLSQQAKSRFDALLFRKHPALFRSRIRPVAPLDYYAIVAALAVLPSALIGAPRWLTVAAIMLWAILTVRFCHRRLHNTTWTPRHVAEMVVTSTLIPPVAVFWRLYGAWRFRTLFF